MPDRVPPFVTIVSGVPRSGTSMMMNMLVAGGMEALTDERRAPDEDNPNGYFEFEAVQRLVEDASWIHQARGKVLKVIHVHVKHLPRDVGLAYRAIVMQRDMREVVASQRAMLHRRGKAGGNLSDERMAQLYALQLRKAVAWMRAEPAFSVLELNYNEILRDPLPSIRAIDAFIGGGLDTAAMGAVIDTALYRSGSGLGSRNGQG